MGDSTHSTTSRDKVRVHRARLRHQGLRLIQIWVPDVRPPQFQAEAHRQSLAVASSARVKTRPSSRPSRTGMTHEARGDLNGLGRPGLRRQGRPRRHSPRRQLHRHGLDHDLRLHDRSNRRAPVPTADRPDRRQWTPVTSPSHLMVDKITTVAGVRVLHQVEPPRPGRG